MEYAKVEPFFAGEKGFGLRAVERIPQDKFIIEYIGEVVDGVEFERRSRRYHKDPNLKHHYFMALDKGAVIDGTVMANISRFINHSCMPNAATQKWTISRQLRIGFFALRDIQHGEEITFDYQFEKFGRVAQRCFCGTKLCRGWIGGEQSEPLPNEGEEQESPREESSEPRAARERSRIRSEMVEDVQLSKVRNRLLSQGKLRNHDDVVQLSRLMIRGDDYDNRLAILGVIQSSAEEIRNGFFSLSGCQIIWTWLIDDENLAPSELATIRLRLIELLDEQNFKIKKNLLEDSNLLKTVTRLGSKHPAAGDAAEEVRAVVKELIAAVVLHECRCLSSPSSASNTPLSSSSSCSSFAALCSAVDGAASADRLRERAALLALKWNSYKRIAKIPKRVTGVTNSTNLDQHHFRSALPTLLSRPPQSASDTTKRGVDVSLGQKVPPVMVSRRSLKTRPRPTQSCSSTRSDGSPSDKKLKRSDSFHTPQRPNAVFSFAGCGSSGDEVRVQQMNEIAMEVRGRLEQAQADFQMTSRQATEQLSKEEQSKVALARPIPLPNQPQLTMDLMNVPDKPAVLVTIPLSGEFWWQEYVTGVLVKKATEAELVAVQLGDWSHVPYFNVDMTSGQLTDVTATIPECRKVLLVLNKLHYSYCSVTTTTPGCSFVTGPAVVPPKKKAAENDSPKPVPPPSVSPASQIAALQKEIEELRKQNSVVNVTVATAEGGDDDMDMSDEDDVKAEPAPSQPAPANAAPTECEKKVTLDEVIAKRVSSSYSLPPPPSVKLSDGWAQAKDAEGNMYYYHKQTRKTQWEPPLAEQVSKESSNKSGLTTATSPTTTTAAADTSTEVTRKARENFKKEMAKHVIQTMEPFRKANKFPTNDDFKKMVRKLTHAILEKEERRGMGAEQLKVTKSILKKSKEYVVKYCAEKLGSASRHLSPFVGADKSNSLAPVATSLADHEEPDISAADD